MGHQNAQQIAQRQIREAKHAMPNRDCPGQWFPVKVDKLSKAVVWCGEECATWGHAADMANDKSNTDTVEIGLQSSAIYTYEIRGQASEGFEPPNITLPLPDDVEPGAPDGHSGAVPEATAVASTKPAQPQKRKPKGASK